MKVKGYMYPQMKKPVGMLLVNCIPGYISCIMDSRNKNLYSFGKQNTNNLSEVVDNLIILIHKYIHMCCDMCLIMVNLSIYRMFSQLDRIIV